VARLFVSIRPPDAALDAIAARLRTAAGGGFVERDRWHLTLCFLGDVDDVDRLSSALGELGSRPPVTLRLGGAGSFGPRRRRQVVWLGLCEGADAVAELAAATRSLLGFEDAPFEPHLTVRRLSSVVDARPVVTALGHEPIGDAWIAREVLLEESSFPHQPVRHSVVSRVTLRG
jgi:2'-5' RNA ligase